MTKYNVIVKNLHIFLSKKEEIILKFIEKDSGRGTIYTSGLSKLGLYDLMIDNVSLAHGSETIPRVLECLSRYSIGFKPVYLHGLLHGNRLLAVMPVSSVSKEDMEYIRDIYNDNDFEYKIAQIVFPNRHGSFPWERIYDKDLSPLPHKLYANMNDKRIATMEIIGMNSLV